MEGLPSSSRSLHCECCHQPEAENQSGHVSSPILVLPGFPSQWQQSLNQQKLITWLHGKGHRSGTAQPGGSIQPGPFACRATRTAVIHPLIHSLIHLVFHVFPLSSCASKAYYLQKFCKSCWGCKDLNIFLHHAPRPPEAQRYVRDLKIANTV